MNTKPLLSPSAACVIGLIAALAIRAADAPKTAGEPVTLDRYEVSGLRVTGIVN